MTQYKAVAPCSLHVALRLCAATAAFALAACATAPATTEAPSAAPAGSIPLETPAIAPGSYQPVQSLGDAQAGAEGIALRDNAPLRYVVKKGDTLWGIANRYLADAWQWPELWYVNGQLKNPHRIYPGDVLELYNVKGRTVLARSEDLERLSPQIRDSLLGDNLPAIPIDAIRNFLNGPRAVDLATLEAAPYLLAFAADNLLGAEGMEVYIKQIADGQGPLFATVRKGVTYKDPDTGELLGYEAIPSGEVEVRGYGVPANGVMTKSTREVLAGDRLLPLEADNFFANFYPHAPANNIDGKIISLYDGVTNVGQFQIVAINRGTRQGLEPGHVLNILQASRKVKDPVTGRVDYLPKQQAGVLMVFKVMPGISYGLVMSATRAVHVLDHVEKPDPTR